MCRPIAPSPFRLLHAHHVIRYVPQNCLANLVFTWPVTVVVCSLICMPRRFFLLLALLPMFGVGCKKAQELTAFVTGSPKPTASPSPTAMVLVSATPNPRPAVNKNARFIELRYHRFEDKAKDLATLPNDFRAQLQALKDNGISVIPMKDVLAWLNEQKSTPNKNPILSLAY